MMGSSSRTGFHISDSDSSDSEELPVIDFSLHRSTQQPRRDPVVLDDSDSDMIHPVPSLACRPVGAAGGDVFMVSSDSDEEEAFIPLAMRLKQKQIGLSTATGKNESPASCVTNGVLVNQSLPVIAESHITSQVPPGDYLLKYSENVHHQSVDNELIRNFKDAVLSRENEALSSKRKRTPAEIEASKDEALRRRVEREKQQVERDKMRVEKKALADSVKALRPEECLKHMVVAVDPGLLQLEGAGDLLTSLHAMGCSYAIEKQPLPRSVSWVRRAPCPQTGELVSVSEAYTVIQVPVEDFISMVHNSRQEEAGDGMSDCGISLSSWVSRLMARNPSRTLSLSVIDIEKYFKTQSSKSRQKFRDAVLGEERGEGPVGGAKKRKRKDAEPLLDISRVEMEEALVNLQLNTGVQVHFHSTWKSFTDYVTMSTKAVAEAPFKREREKTGFSFCLESEWAGGQKVDRAGKGLLQVWKRQIQQLNRVSTDMASAILNAYPSPQLLIQAYKRCKSEREKVTLLSDILIRRGEGVTSTTRRVGPELSKRLFLLMTSADAQQTLDSAV